MLSPETATSKTEASEAESGFPAGVSSETDPVVAAARAATNGQYDSLEEHQADEEKYTLKEPANESTFQATTLDTPALAPEQGVSSSSPESSPVLSEAVGATKEQNEIARDLATQAADYPEYQGQLAREIKVKLQKMAQIGNVSGNKSPEVLALVNDIFYTSGLVPALQERLRDNLNKLYATLPTSAPTPETNPKTSFYQEIQTMSETATDLIKLISKLETNKKAADLEIREVTIDAIRDIQRNLENAGDLIRQYNNGVEPETATREIDEAWSMISNLPRDLQAPVKEIATRMISTLRGLNK